MVNQYFILQTIPGINLVVIGVGQLSARNILKELCDSTDRGRYIDIKADRAVDLAITSAFEEVGASLSEVEVEGFVSDD